MDTARGRRTFVEFFTNYNVPVVPELAADLGRIDCPTAVIWGDRDRYIPFATARELAERIPGATLTRLAGADRPLHHGGASRRRDGGAARTADPAAARCPSRSTYQPIRSNVPAW
jgi:hypothetical protein